MPLSVNDDRRPRPAQRFAGDSPLRSRATVSVTLVALGLAACGANRPAEPPPPALAPATAPPEAPAADLPPSPARLLDAFIDEYLVRFPAKGRELGLHEHDGRIADYSPSGIESVRQWLKAWQERLSAVDAAGDDDLQLDRDLAIGACRLALFELDDRRAPSKDPMFYGELYAVNDYLDREYAPLEQRVAALASHAEAALAQVERPRENLSAPLPRAIVETAIKNYRGYAEYLRGDVRTLVGAAKEEATRQRALDAAEKLGAAADAFATFLQKIELPRADESHVLGEAKFRRLLDVQEGLTTSLDDLSAMAEKNLTENRLAYEALARKLRPTRPPVAKLFSEAERLVALSKRFVVEKRLVTLPADEPLLVRETPPFMRWNQAFLNAPGPFEGAGTNALYYITLPDPKWPAREQREYVLPTGVLVATTVHEAYPGHFLQGLWMRRAPTRAQKVFDSYSFVEGWAHYVEQLMVEEGFLTEDPQTALGQLSDALLRNCRFVASIGIHARGLSVEAMARRFEKECHQDPVTAREQAVRGTFDPGYFAYTLGKVQILDLRETAKAALGADFSLQRFHDALLSHGAPPVPLIRARVLREVGAPARPGPEQKRAQNHAVSK